MTRSPDVVEATRQLAGRSGTAAEDWHLVVKARYGLQVVFRTLAALRGPGDVVTQVFTCATAVDPILVGGLRPVYAEVSPATIAIDPDRFEVGASTRAVVLQHTFGIVDDAADRRVAHRARTMGAMLVENSAHCVGRLARDDDGTPVADVSVHSFGVETMLPTRFGGAVWVNPALRDDALRERLVADLAGLPATGRRLDLAARTYRSQLRVLNRLPAGVGGPLRGALTRYGLFEPAIAPVERRGGLAYAPLAPSPWMVRQIVRELPSLDAVQARRAAATAEYAHELAGLVQIPAAIGDDDALVRFPFFAADTPTAERLITTLSAAGVYAGRWYRPALFPGAEDPAVYGYTPGDGTLTTTEDLIARVVNLPTGVDVSRAREIAALVRTAIG